MNRISQARGWTAADLWAATPGPVNELITETDYADLADLERETRGQQNDAEWMAGLRRLGAAVEPRSVHSQLLETAPHLA